MNTTLRRLWSLSIAGAIAVTACGGSDDDAAPPAEPAGDVAAADAAADRPEYGLVSPAEAAELAVADGITVIDVRTPEEFGEGHLQNAELIDFYTDTFADEIAGLDPDGEYLIYCRSGNRSGQTNALMQQLGFEQVYDLDGGVVAYSADGLPLVMP